MEDGGRSTQQAHTGTEQKGRAERAQMSRTGPLGAMDL